MDDMIASLKRRSQAYQELLREEGFSAKDPEWDDRTNTWDISVKYEGIPLLIMLDLDDQDFVRIMLGNFWEVKPEHLGAALIALDIANKTAKGAKVFLGKDRKDTFASADFLDGGSGRIEARQLVRSLGMVAHAAKTYVMAFKEQVVK